MAFDYELLQSLLGMQEGPTLDFKSEQYKFALESDSEKSKLFKDILAFANTPRDTTAYILLGVEEVNGECSKVVGVEEHLKDADLHEFMKRKTNERINFNYSTAQYDGKQIGIISIPIQDYLLWSNVKFGGVDRYALYYRYGSSNQQASPDEIIAMRKREAPSLLRWSINRLQNLAKGAVMTVTQEWWEHPDRRIGYELDWEPHSYEESRELVLKIVEKRKIGFTGFPITTDSYESLQWVFGRFERLAEFCTETTTTINSILVQSGGLMRAIADMASLIDFEKPVWDEFRLRANDRNAILPREARYNLVTVAVRAIRFVDFLEDTERHEEPDYDPVARFSPPTFLRSPQWGHWRR